jgi:hypothetical protein
MKTRSRQADRRQPLHRGNGENNDKIRVNFAAGAQSDRG